MNKNNERFKNKVKYIVLLSGILAYYYLVWTLGISSILTDIVLPLLFGGVGSGIWYILRDKNAYIRKYTDELVEKINIATQAEEVKIATAQESHKENIRKRIEIGIKLKGELTDEIEIYHSTIFSLVDAIIVVIVGYILIASVITAPSFNSQILITIGLGVLAFLFVLYFGRRGYLKLKKLEQMQKIISRMRSDSSDILKTIGEIYVK